MKRLLLLITMLVCVSSIYADSIIEPVHTVMSVDGRVSGMAISPDGERLAVADDGKSFSLFDLETGERINQFVIGAGEAYLEDGVHYSPDGSLIAVGGFSLTWMFDGVTGDLLYELASGADDVAFSPDGSLFYMLSSDIIIVYESVTGVLLQSAAVAPGDDGRSASDLEVLADGSLVLLMPNESYDYYVTIVSPDLTSIVTTPINGRDLLTGGQMILNVFYTTLTIYLDPNGAGVQMMPSEPCGDFVAYDFSPDNQYLAAIAGNCSLHIFDAGTGEEVYMQAIPDAGKVAFGEDMLFISSASSITAYQVINTSAESVEAVESSQYQLVYNTTIGGVGFAGVAVSPAGDKVAAIAGFDNLIIAYNTADYSEIGRYEGNAGSSQITYSADGAYLVAVDSDSLLLIFDAATMTLLHELRLQGDYTGAILADATSAYIHSNATNEANHYLNKVDLATGVLSSQTVAFDNITTMLYLSMQADETLIGAAMSNEGVQLKTWDTDLNELSMIIPGWWGIEYIGDFYLYWMAYRENDITYYAYNHQATLEDEASYMGSDTCLLDNFVVDPAGEFAIGIRFRCAMTLFNIASNQADVRMEGETIGSDLALFEDTLYVATSQGIEIYMITSAS